VIQGLIWKRGKRGNSKDGIDLVIPDIIMQVIERSCDEGTISKAKVFPE